MGLTVPGLLRVKRGELLGDLVGKLPDKPDKPVALEVEDLSEVLNLDPKSLVSEDFLTTTGLSPKAESGISTKSGEMKLQKRKRVRPDPKQAFARLMIRAKFFVSPPKTGASSNGGTRSSLGTDTRPSGVISHPLGPRQAVEPPFITPTATVWIL